MMRGSRTPVALALILVMLTTTLVPLTDADGSSSTPTINIDWIDHDEDGNADQAYIIGFSETTNNADFTVEVSQYNSTGSDIGAWTFVWDDANFTISPLNLTHHRITVPSNLSFGDSIDVEVFANPGGESLAIRNITVTIWNQPIADHEITVTTDWSLQHTIENETTESYQLDFSGQGWQERTAGILIHDELGTGALTIDEELTSGSMIHMEIDLTKIWLNETMNGEEFTSQIFEMAGAGNMTITDNNDGNLTINADVEDAYILRSNVEGLIEEQLRLEANGNFNLTKSGEDGDTTINAEISLLLVEIHDINGVRVLDHSQFEATGDLEIQNSGSYINVDLQQLMSLARYENGEMVLQHDKVYGDGTFFYSDTNDENGSIVINGDVILLHQETENGTKTADSIHIDGDITGATTGTFGVWRRIQDSGQSANSTGVMWDVNRIHEENWFNLTGGGILDGMGPQQTYNETWDHEVIYENYTNRTIYYSWYEQSNDPSQGEEWPPNSPIPVEETEETTNESGLGDINISRESGLAPSELLIGDNLGLYSGDLMVLELTANSYQTYTRDGHTMDVTAWNGTYKGDASNAYGLVINEGILAGLVAEVSREVYIDFNETDDAWFWENQSLERVLSPSIVTAGENTPPSVVEVRLQEGQVVNEGGNLVHIEVQIADPDWNLREVSADLSSLGLGTILLNDLGQDGDIMVHDDNFTGSFIYFGTLAGDITIDIVAEDAWTTTNNQESIPVSHRAPRLTDFTLNVESVDRGESVNVTVRAFDALPISSVAIDLRGEGGELFNLTSDGEGLWLGSAVIPTTISPGNLLLPVKVEDNQGGWALTSTLNLPSEFVGQGGDAWDAPTTIITPLLISNAGPEISNFTILKNGVEVNEIIVPDVGDGNSLYVLTVNATDHDIITVVQGKFGMLAPVGQDTSWLSMTDDGIGADALAGDGIYSIEISVRQGIPADTEVLEFRGIDVYLKTTEPVFEVTVNLSEQEVDPLTNPTDALTDWGSTGVIVAILLGLVMLGAGVTIVILMRKGGSLEDQLGIKSERNL